MTSTEASAAPSNNVPRRRRFQFSLRMIMLAMTLAGVWLGWNYWEVRTRAALRNELGWRGAVVRSADPQSPNKLPTMWRLFGAQPFRAIELPGDAFNDEDLRKVQRWFPEAEVIMYGRSAGMM
jgi:hypothetical protein